MLSRAWLLCMGGLQLSEASLASEAMYVLDGECAQDSSNCITSPNFGDSGATYPGEQTCTIQVGELFFGARVQAFDTEGLFDHLIVGDRDYSGNFRPDITFTPGTMTWSSDSSGVATGFKLCPNDLTGPTWELLGGECAIDATTGCLTTPSWPSDYQNNMRCDVVVPSNFAGASAVAFDLDSGDPLQMPDGSDVYGGIPNNIYPAPGSQIVWTPDSATSGSGWKLCPVNQLGVSGGAFESMPASVAMAQGGALHSPAVQGASRLWSAAPLHMPDARGGMLFGALAAVAIAAAMALTLSRRQGTRAGSLVVERVHPFQRVEQTEPPLL